MRSIDRKNGVEHPVAVGALEEHLLTGFGIDDAQRIVGTAESDLGAIGRPAGSKNRVECDGCGELQAAVGDIPDLDLARSRRIASGHSEQLAIR